MGEAIKNPIINGIPVLQHAVTDKTNLRSEIAQEIISRRSGPMERYALLLFLLVLIAILVVSMFINYPDIIESRIKLTAANAPKEIIPHADGRLVKLFVHNDELVNKDQQLGWIESLASHEEVLKLSDEVSKSISLLKASRLTECSMVFNEHLHNLGELQPSYQQFISLWQQFNDYVVNGFYARKRHFLNEDIISLEKMKHAIKAQLSLYEQDVKLSDETYSMNKSLFEDKVISSEELRNANSKSINKQLAIPQLNASLIANESQQRNLVKEIDQLDHDMSIQKMLFEQALQSLKTALDNWKRKYILFSPVNGKVSFIVSLQENQFLYSEKIIGYINPFNAQYYAEAYFSQENFGKIDTGLKAQLRFDAYPYQEYGTVDGSVNYISKVAYDSGFLTTIKLDSVLLTSNNRIIPYKNGLNAQAIIITKDMRLLERLYYDITKSLSVNE